ncbi:MAG: hypothetical protein HKN42_00635 [Granulosicoccus sp.]|nr:hypothetical protein [Granulosicoccus sp.]
MKIPVEELLYQPQDGRASVVRSEEYFFSEIYEDPESFAVELEGLVSTMVEWIGDAGDYEVDHLIAAPPRIFFATVGEILDFGNGPLEIRPGLRGAYSDEIDTLVIVLPWSIDDQVSRSILLHELVHAVQASARDWNCLAEQEWEAYQLQHRWLAEQGLDWTLDWLLVGIMSRCPDTVE